jgi:phage repressor protein C with HTH and peptisase S24 domain
MLLKDRIAKVLTESGERTQGAFATSVGMDLDRLKNLLGGRAARLRPEEAQAIERRYGWREVWLTDGKGAQRLTREEQALLSGEGAPLPSLRRATELLVSQGVSDPRAIDWTQRLYLAASKRDSEAMDGAMVGLLKLMASGHELDLRESAARDGDGPAAPALKTARRMPAYKLADEFVYVAKYEVTASAGNGAVIHDEAVVDHLAFKRSWIAQTLGLDPLHLALIDARGDSMSPTIESGDLLLLDTRKCGAKSEGIYVINLSGALLVKRLRMKLSGTVEVMSDNPKYSSESISGSELDRLILVGRVVWHGRKI